MAKTLERDLGLFEVMAISIGAMIGSGIFILPALAIDIAGPAVILAYLVAGILVIPAALSKSEMATAMPEAGGTYLYIERGMGPLMGTIAGIGTWFSLSFKSALALAGGIPYLLLVLELPQQPVALGLGVLLIIVNMVGVKQTGRLQFWIVTVMLAALTWFVAGSAGAVQTSGYANFMGKGVEGILAATGLVFVSYAGVTKIASVAEEIENPGKNIPIGIMGSLIFTTLLYVLIVTAIVGVISAGEIAGSLTPMADAAENSMGMYGYFGVIGAAMLALVSTANAGLLSSSRYPFAMSRDQLVPDLFGSIHDRFNTPINSITLTGTLMLILIAFVPVMEIAKLASAFQILVFILINISLIAFREGDPEGYEPEFISPVYPWVQIFGILSGIVLLTQMGDIAIAGAVGILLTGFVGYYMYGKKRVDREGVASETLREKQKQNVVERTRKEMEEEESYRVLVALDHPVDEEHESHLIDIAEDIALRNNGSIEAVLFDEVPDQTPLEYASSVLTGEDEDFERRTSRITDSLEVPSGYGEVASHDTTEAISNYIRRNQIDLVILDRKKAYRGRDFQNFWITRNALSDTVIVNDRDLDDLSKISIVTDKGPYDPLKVKIGDAIAQEKGAKLELVYLSERSESTKEDISSYHEELAELCNSEITYRVEGTKDGLLKSLEETDLVITASNMNKWSSLIKGPESWITKNVDSTVLEVLQRREKQPNLLEKIIEKYFF